MKITPKQLHDWYLEATEKLNPENFNPKAQKAYQDLTPEHQYIDRYIATKIRNKVKEYSREILKAFEEILLPLGVKIKLINSITSNEATCFCGTQVPFKIKNNQVVEPVICQECGQRL
jgi:nucleoid-associated protein YejK